ncbi:hypothetical protein H6P81_017362 [Aristolochia fimbriata]|uniref:Uncharacterized protein n=1 Tax=Aristolochia fimbriata TaxID=158543 RepID=A0AAV7DYT7_ARIFI|nr:hypothetical protein H6P81_017362 [Aristolochia fimbriata]
MPSTAGGIDLKLLLDKASDRVVGAECDSEFVNVLFSFLTMPLGAIISLFRKETKLGCMDELYQSVEALDEWYFQNKAFKTMLLRPRSSSEFKSANPAAVATSSDDYDILYACYDKKCWLTTRFVSYYSNCPCPCCGRIMGRQLVMHSNPRSDLPLTKFVRLGGPKSSTGGVFTQGRKEFVVTDDLQIITFATTERGTLSVLKRLGIKDGNFVVGRDIKIGSEEVLRLLKCSLRSHTALTDTFLASTPTAEIKLKSTGLKMPNSGSSTNQANKGRRMMGKLVMNRSTKQVLYLEAREDLVNQILSFLTFPLGSVLKLLMGRSGSPLKMGSCVYNIYKAAKDLISKESDLFNSEESKTELLCPRLGCFAGCDDQLLTDHLVEADSSQYYSVASCSRCIYPWVYIIDTEPGLCRHGKKKVEMRPINPKYPSSNRGGGYLKIKTKYMITDDLSVQPISSTRVVLSLISKYKLSVDELEEQEISIGEDEAARMLRASMTSKTVLTDVFVHPEKAK